MEHISMFLAQLGEVSAFDFMKVRNFPLSLTGTTFAWFTLLPSCSIGSWAELEEKFHNHFYNGAHETRLSYLASVRKGRDEPVLDFFKRFREIQSKFHLLILILMNRLERRTRNHLILCWPFNFSMEQLFVIIIRAIRIIINKMHTLMM